MYPKGCKPFLAFIFKQLSIKKTIDFLKFILNFYIKSSLHIAFSCYAFIKITENFIEIKNESLVNQFVFFGTILGYNFVKYENIIKTKKTSILLTLKAIFILSFFSFLVTFFLFFKLEKNTQFFVLFLVSFLILYTKPIFGIKKNLRNSAGLKIYLVSFYWMCVSVILPIINFIHNPQNDIKNSKLENYSLIFNACLQRFIEVFVLILFFDIADLKTDSKLLKTIPQQIGLLKTKILILFVLIFYLLLSYFNNICFDFCLIFTSITLLFLIFINEQKSILFTALGVESIPIFCWIFLTLL